jgi:hypothetical protein
MSILKNEPIYPFKEGDYTKPRHIIVEGTNEEICFALGSLAKNEYDGTELPYDFYGDTRGAKDLGATLSCCSAVVLPHEQTDTGAPYVSRNLDWLPLVMWDQ